MRRTPLLVLLVATVALLPAIRSSGADHASVRRATLRNGLRIVVVRDALAPVATTVVTYRVGSFNAPPGFPGTPHALEHMMFRGAPGLSAEQLASIAAALGGDFNAETEETATRYYFTVPATDVPLALRVEALRMRAILATDASWARERGAIEQEVAQDLSDPEYRLFSRLRSLLFAGTPLAHDALGTRESFDRTSAARLRRFHREWYVPNNAVLVVAGDVDPARTLAQVRTLFESIPARQLPHRPRIRPAPLHASAFERESDRPEGLAVLAFRFPGFDSPDSAAAQVLVDVLGSRRGELYGLVPDGKALSAEFDYEPFPGAGVGYAIASYPRGGDGAALAAHVKAALRRAVTGGVSPQLVEAAKRRAVTAAEFRKNSVQGLALAWAQALAVEDRSSPDDAVEAIRKVTAADVDRVVGRYLDLDTATQALLKPHEAGVSLTARPGRHVESPASEPSGPVALPSWARKPLSTLPSYVPPPQPQDRLLANGLRLVLCPRPGSRTVGVFGRIRTNPDVQTPQGKEGVADLLEELFPWGSTSLDRLGLETELDRIAADETAGTHFSLEVLAANFDRGAALLADNLLHPALPEGAFETLRRQKTEALAGLLDSPAYQARRALREALLPPGDPALREATPATVASVTLEDVKVYFQRVFRPDLTTVVVVGDVDPAHAEEVIETLFGSWTAEGPPPDTDLSPVPPNAPSSVAVQDPGREQEEVTLAQTVAVGRGHPDYYALTLGTEVLGGGFFAARLYRDLRERSGLVYSAEAALEAGRKRSTYVVAYGCDPPNAATARAIVDRDLRFLQEVPIGPAELERAKSLLIRQLALANADVEGVAEGLLERSLNGLPLDEPVAAAERYRDLTAEEVRAAFARWLRPQDLAQVSLAPPQT
ncbi:MAG: insulinase family protein [Deltaproteobacteria bacterium]|nr:insulinase family protein [Deltaproteobacteria bacterium]